MRILRSACLAFVVVLLSACASPPLFQQLQDNKVSKITLLVEEAPFTFTSPATPETSTGGTRAVGLFGALVGVALQGGLTSSNAQLAEARRVAGVTADHRTAFVDHRTAFVDQLTKAFAARGVEVQAVRVPFETNSLGGDRSFVRPVPDVVDRLDLRGQVFSLNFDAGTCSFQATPCIRVMLRPMAFVGPGATSTSKYRHVMLTEPDYRKDDKTAKRVSFPLEDGKANIQRFDAAIAALVPVAVDRLITELDTDRGPR